MIPEPRTIVERRHLAVTLMRVVAIYLTFRAVQYFLWWGSTGFYTGFARLTGPPFTDVVYALAYLAGAVVLVRYGDRLAVWAVPFRPAVCPACGYPLKGLTGDTCPECGLSLASRERDGGRAPSWQARLMNRREIVQIVLKVAGLLVVTVYGALNIAILVVAMIQAELTGPGWVSRAWWTAPDWGVALPPGLIYLVGGVALIVLSRRLARWLVPMRPLSTSRCPECGYPLTGLARPVCPECGLGLAGIVDGPSDAGPA